LHIILTTAFSLFHIVTLNLRTLALPIQKHIDNPHRP
jgi:hypothetical protein